MKGDEAARGGEERADFPLFPSERKRSGQAYPQVVFWVGWHGYQSL
jgi:hypothetical protein